MIVTQTYYKSVVKIWTKRTVYIVLNVNRHRLNTRNSKCLISNNHKIKIRDNNITNVPEEF